MFYNLTIDLTKAIIDTLKQFNKPLSLDEISFRTRSLDTSVAYTLSQLVRANVVIEEGGSFKLNREKGQYRFKNLIT